MTTPDRPYAVVSTDTHGGADLLGYKPYLSGQWHEAFDVWAAGFSDGWSSLDEGDGDGEHGFGVSSFLAPVNWDSAQRQQHLEAEGIAAEVIYPNTVPPFYPSGAISAPGPRTAEEYGRRWAGIQAHNRWLADFCGEVPGRRVGLAQVFLVDIDDAIAEVSEAKELGLKGVLLPSDHFLGLSNLFLPRLDPFWRACEELQMPVHSHGIVPAEAASSEAGDASPAVGAFELRFFMRRPLAHLMLAGVFEKFPELQYVLTETTCSWIPSSLEALDMFCLGAMRRKGSVEASFAHDAVAKLGRTPSEYFSTNCHLATFLTEADIDARHVIGVDRMMWGADYPHHEGTWPYTRQALRANFADVPEDEVRRMTSLNAIELYGLDPVLLQAVADRIGPRPSEVARPLTAEEWPTDAACQTFALTGLPG